MKRLKGLQRPFKESPISSEVEQLDVAKGLLKYQGPCQLQGSSVKPTALLLNARVLSSVQCVSQQESIALLLLT